MAHEYVETYLANLPPQLRPIVNETILGYLRTAWTNGWNAKDLADSVSAGNYQNSSNLIGSAVYRLSKIVEQKAYVRAESKSFVAPDVERIPDEWRRERVALLRYVMVHKIGADEASKLMQELIKKQEDCV